MKKSELKNIIRECILREIKINTPGLYTKKQLDELINQLKSQGLTWHQDILPKIRKYLDRGRSLLEATPEEINKIYLDLLKNKAKLKEVKINKPTWYVLFEDLKPGMIGEDYGSRKVVIVDKGTYDEMNQLFDLYGWEDEDIETFGSECVAVVDIEDYDFEENEDLGEPKVFAYDGAGVLVPKDWKKWLPKGEKVDEIKINDPVRKPFTEEELYDLMSVVDDKLSPAEIQKIWLNRIDIDTLNKLNDRDKRNLKGVFNNIDK